MEKITSNKNDYLLSIFVASYFFIEALNTSIKQLFFISDTLWTRMSNGFMFILFFILILTIKYMLRRNGFAFLIAEIIYLTLYGISFFKGNADTNHLFSSAFQTLGVALPIAFYVISIFEKNILLDVLRKTGYVQSILLITTLFSMNEKSSYSMSASYFLVLPTLIFLHSFFRKKSIIDFLFASVSVLSILLYGARGPLLGIAVYIFVKTVLLTDLSIRKVVFSLIISASLVSLVIFWDNVLLIMLTFLQSRGIHSRTLNSIIRSTITGLSGRDILFKYYWNLALQKPILGWGALGGWTGPGSGPHNTMIEIILAFGFILGPILCMISIYLLFRGFFGKAINSKEILIIYSSLVVPMFFVSGGFFTSVNWMVFFIMGLYHLLLNYTFQETSSEMSMSSKVNVLKYSSS